MEVAMSIPSRLCSWLDEHGAHYELCPHQHSRTSAETARTAHVPPHQIAKSVLLEDDDGCVVAVLPADRNVRLHALSELLERERLRLADEDRIAELFADCERGAIPALGMAWGLETVVDEALDGNAVVYIEGGDHEHLLRMSRDDFHALMRSAHHGHFSGDRLH
jgi:Ala-tRNA(Pro) deacylase